MKIELEARDLVIMPFDRVNDQPVARKPLLIDIDGRDYVEFYVGYDDPERLEYFRIVMPADQPIELEVPDL